MELLDYNNRKELISKQIQNLLRFHDCVIIPGFGGLICNYKASETHPVSHNFQPPQKQIVFNKNLKSDDGLLVNTLVTSLGLAYQDARHWLKETSDTLSQMLTAGNREKLEGIGEFRKDIENNIRFFQSSSENYLLNSYGLSGFHAAPINRYPIPDRNRKSSLPDKQVAVEIPAVKKPIRLRKIIGSGVMIMLLFFLSYLSLNYGGPLYKNITTLKIGFSNSQKITPLHLPASLNFKPVSRQVFAPLGSQFNAENARIFIIDGCYANVYNALGRTEYLNEKGYKAFILDFTFSGLYRIALGSYSDIENANHELSNIRESLSKEAWLLVK